MQRTPKLKDTYGREFNLPNFTMKDILEAIPSNRTWPLGFLGGLCMQGCFGTGVWVLAHECGRDAFSPWRKLNDSVGWMLRSSLLVQYFSWQITHSKHHKATAHLSKDTVFVPKTLSSLIMRRGADPAYFSLDEEITEEQENKLCNLIEEASIISLSILIVQQPLEWLRYLTLNLLGQKYSNRSK